MNKSELVVSLARCTSLSVGLSRTVIDSIFDPDPASGLIARELLAGRRVSISGFGTFEARPRKARVGRNPQTGAALSIPASRAPAFRPGKPLKEAFRAH